MTTTNSDSLLPAQGIEAPRSGRIDPKYLRTKGSNGSFEMAAWVFMRVSGLALVVLIFVHLWVNLMVGDGIHQIDFGFVAGKWANPVWQFWDLTMLWLAMLHGTNGMRTIIDDYAERTGVPSLMRRLSDLGIGFKDLSTRQSSLEDIFVGLVHQDREAA